MTRHILAAVLAAMAVSGAVGTAAQAQTAAENFSYKAPSGMFGDGTTKWNMYRFMFEDAERMEKLRAGEATTGSVQGSATSDETVARPGERGTRRNRAR